MSFGSLGMLVVGSSDPRTTPDMGASEIHQYSAQVLHKVVVVVDFWNHYTQGESLLYMQPEYKMN